MPFVRHLSRAFIDALNEEYGRPRSWWRQVVDDRENNVFLAIRKNSINAYAGGGSVARINWTGNRIELRVHSSFLVFPSQANEGNRYPDLLQLDRPRAIRVSSPGQYRKHFNQIVRLSESLSDRERNFENRMAARILEVVDIEAAFDTESRPGDTEERFRAQSSGRLDFVTRVDGRLIATELKLLSNPDLVRPEVPVVCSQLRDYANWLTGNQTNIEEQYIKVVDYYHRLKGRFFECRRELPQVESVDPVPRLLISDHGRQDGNRIRTIRERVVDGCVSLELGGFDRRHVRNVGNWESARLRHLVG